MDIKEEIQTLVDEYITWLKNKTELGKIDDKWVEITTPHLDRHNDCLQIYVRKESGGYIITDDGYIINDLINSGCALDSRRRKDLLATTLAGFGVRLDGDQMVVRATSDNFPIRKHNLIQAMLAVNDLFYLATPFTLSLFFEDVTNWLDNSDIRYTPKVKFTGKSGYDHMFDFVIPKSRTKPERILQLINNPKKDTMQQIVFKWLDTKETRPPDSRLYAFLNDVDSNVSAASIDALRNYDLNPVPWTERENAKEELAA